MKYRLLRERRSMHFEFLDTLDEGWQPVSKPRLIGWLIFYGVFLLYALSNKTGFLFIDLVFVPIHEGGHLLFSWFGETLAVMGGTILQLFVPLAIAVYFVFERQLPGAAFAAFFFFENFLNISTYMADARRRELPLITVGDGEGVIHDWFFMFSKVGLLERDTAIAAVVRMLGWMGMFGVVVFLWWKAKAPSREP
jgi:hypothetical protein